MAERALRWECQPTSQVQEHRTAAPTTFCSVRTRGIRGGVRAIQCCGARSWSSATNRPGWRCACGMADSGARYARPRGTDVGEFHRPTVVSGGRLPVGGPLQPDPRELTAWPPSPPAAAPCPAARWWAAGTSPTAAWRAPARRLASRPAPVHGPGPAVGQPGAGAVDSRCGRGAPSVPGFAAGDQPVVAEETAIPGRSITGSAVTSAGMLLCEGFRQAGSQGVGQRRGHRRQHACVGSAHQHVRSARRSCRPKPVG